MRTVRIFVSSPGDVLPERHRSSQVIARLAQRFGSELALEPIFWEWEPLTADKHFQENIIPPSTTDVVVMILWSKLGTLLPIEKYRGRISNKQVTGTEWEFEDALGAPESSRPTMLVYIKKAPYKIEIINSKDKRSDEIKENMERLECFLKTWFWDEKESVYKGSQREFTDTSVFEEMLERHLDRFLQQFIEKGSSAHRAGHWHQGSPFRGLQSFDVGHTDIFFGRTRARNELREMLVAQFDHGSAFVVVVGASGCGKSSLVRAGLIPDLKLPGMVPQVGLVRYAILRPRDADANPLTALASGLMSALPELQSLLYTQEILEELIADSPAKAMLPINQGLAAARQNAKLTESAEARLLIVVDQLEELFTLPLSEQTRLGFVTALDNLARSSSTWVVATMRTDFMSRLAEEAKLAELARGAGTFLLSPPTPEELGQIILRPAETAGVEYETNRDTGQRLDEELRRAAGNNPGALPLLEYLLERLWQERDTDGRLTFDAYTRLGGLEG
ncbi:MAG TPA: ATP-binding protein, partial [Blastocatellia bacterium]|nr:ATP-binding protein [Blastocatellia bacterium]